VTLFTIFSNAGLGTLLVKDVARDNERIGKYIGNVLSLRLFLSFFVLLLIVLLTHLIKFDGDKRQLIYILGFTSVIGVNMETFISAFRATTK